MFSVDFWSNFNLSKLLSNESEEKGWLFSATECGGDNSVICHTSKNFNNETKIAAKFLD